MLRCVFITYNDFSTKDGWVFSLVNIVVCYTWIRSFDVRSLNSCKCVARWIYVIIGCWGKCLAVSSVILRTLDECKCFRCLGKVILWSRLCLAMFIFILLSGMNDLRQWINMTWSTQVENISSRGNSFGLGPHFCQQNKPVQLKKMIIRTTCKAVNCFSNIARVK